MKWTQELLRELHAEGMLSAKGKDILINLILRGDEESLKDRRIAALSEKEDSGK